MSDDLQWTGERYIPNEGGPVIAYEHLHRYALATGLAAGRRVLDLGSGEGYGSALMSTVARSVDGIDIDPDAVRHANTKYGSTSVQFARGDITTPLEHGDPFDLVVCFEAIEHVAEPERVVAAARAALADHGIFVVSTPNKKLYSDERSFHNEFHEHELTLDEFETLLTSAFAHVAILGQQVAGVSISWPLHAPADAATRYLDASGRQRTAHGVGDVLEPLYFVAICSQEAIDESILITSVFLDEQNVLIAAHEELTQRVGGLKEHIVELETHRDVVVAHKDELTKRVADLEHELKLLRADHEALTGEIDAIHHTVSWRLTSPIRAVQQAIRGHRGGATPP